MWRAAAASAKALRNVAVRMQLLFVILYAPACGCVSFSGQDV
jgi:hypothetical protein